jgi:hypothetical protein
MPGAGPGGGAAGAKWEVRFVTCSGRYPANKTCLRILRMSVHRGRPEVAAIRSNRRK